VADDAGSAKPSLPVRGPGRVAPSGTVVAAEKC